MHRQQVFHHSLAILRLRNQHARTGRKRKAVARARPRFLSSAYALIPQRQPERDHPRFSFNARAALMASSICWEVSLSVPLRRDSSPITQSTSGSGVLKCVRTLNADTIVSPLSLLSILPLSISFCRTVP
jgi:hypothetical protein